MGAQFKRMEVIYRQPHDDAELKSLRADNRRQGRRILWLLLFCLLQLAAIVALVYVFRPR